MGEKETQMNLERLKESFPTLDDHSARTLLGGEYQPGDYWDPDWNTNHGSGQGDFTYAMMSPDRQDSFLNSPYNPSNRPNGNSAGGGGNVYFGDTDDSYGDLADAGWGGFDFEDVGDNSNPSGPEEGYSESPGGEQEEFVPPWKGPLPVRTNSDSALSESYDIKNDSDYPVMIQYGPFGTTPHIVQPGDEWSYSNWFNDIDGINIRGYLFKLTDGFGSVRITNAGFDTNYSFPGSEDIYRERGGLQLRPPTTDGNWSTIFYWSPQWP